VRACVCCAVSVSSRTHAHVCACECVMVHIVPHTCTSSHVRERKRVLCNIGVVPYPSAQSHVHHASFTYVSFTYVACLIHSCDMTHPDIGRDSFICGTWLICMWDTTRRSVSSGERAGAIMCWRYSLWWRVSFVGFRLALFHMCDMTHLYIETWITGLPWLLQGGVES